MGRTITEKILARHTDTSDFKPGDIIKCRTDLIMGHDLTAPHAVHVFRQFGLKKINESGKTVLIQDHFQPSKDISSAELAKIMRDFAREQGIEKYFEVIAGGICHILILEKGFVRPGMLVAGADSHTSTCGAVGALGCAVGATELAALWALGELRIDVPHSRKIVFRGKPQKWVTGKDMILALLSMLGQEGAINESLEFYGDTFDDLPIPDRVTIANMSVESGACTAVILQNKIVSQYLSNSGFEEGESLSPDSDAEYVAENELRIDKLSPLVALPPSPARVRPVDKIESVKIDQVFLGSCANGMLEDFRRFSEVMGDKKFAPNVRVIAVPATVDIYLAALREGIVEKIIRAGGAVQISGCGPCIGGHLGVLASGETCLSTSNRNFKGRMGHHNSVVYLSGPAVAAASAIAGRIVHPSEVAD